MMGSQPEYVFTIRYQQHCEKLHYCLPVDAEHGSMEFAPKLKAALYAQLF